MRLPKDQERLLNLACGLLVQKLMKPKRLSAFQFRMDVEPSVEFLFRPEEIVNPSTAATENPGIGRLRFLDLSVGKNDPDRLSAQL